MSIKILLTGGTIDKHYNEANGKLHFVDSNIPEILKLGRNKSEINLEQVMLKDSLEMNDEDRATILNACKNSSEDKIVITHGTDTMAQTAHALGGDAELNKTIVLVGAMIPYVFKHSDGVFNLGFALAAVQTLPTGIYVAMNGKIFNGNEVVKNLAEGIFEEKQ